MLDNFCIPHETTYKTCGTIIIFYLFTNYHFKMSTFEMKTAAWKLLNSQSGSKETFCFVFYFLDFYLFFIKMIKKIDFKRWKLEKWPSLMDGENVRTVIPFTV